MKIGKTNTGELIIRLDAGDDILASIETACVTGEIANAEITGLGSIEAPTLAHYSRITKHFTEREFVGIFEVVSLVGNVSLVDGLPKAHAHVVISNEQMETFGGHLVRGVCSATVELIVRPLGSAYKKAKDAEVGLKLWRLE